MKALCCLIVVFVVALTAACHKPLYSGVAQIEMADSPGQRKVTESRATPLEKVIAAAVEQANYTKGYDPAYTKIDYPNGDVPKETGVCADVIVRAFRAANIDLQKEIHEDMSGNFAAYPKTWGARRPDANIDHRRVGNLMKWFERQHKSLPVTKRETDYAPGDVVAWELGNGRQHIGLITDVRNNGAARYLVAHNIGAGAQVEDVLFAWQVIGHYRYFQKSEPAQTASSSGAAAELKIGTLGRDLIDGCGCSLQLLQDFRRKSSRYIFIHNFHEAPVMNIDGQNIKLEELAQGKPPQGESRKGERHTERYRAGDLNVRIDYVVTGVCDPKDEGCEVTWYDATLTVTRGDQKKVVKAVGVCGC